MPLDAQSLAESADEASSFLKSLASPVRLRILCVIAEREVCVGDIVKALNARQSVVSQHLTVLRNDGFVRARRDGQTIWYKLADQRVIGVMRYLQSVFCPAGARATMRSGK